MEVSLSCVKMDTGLQLMSRSALSITAAAFETMLETLAALAEREAIADMIDGTVVRADHSAVRMTNGAKEPDALTLIFLYQDSSPYVFNSRQEVQHFWSRRAGEIVKFSCIFTLRN